MARSRSGTVTRDYRLSELLEFIHAGEIVLPEFQRDFDWGVDRVGQLLATVSRKWPAGSLLLQEFSDNQIYRLRAFEGGPELDTDRVEFTVLDGQQRLTALYQAVYDVGDTVMAVRARVLKPGTPIEDLEDNIRAFTRPQWDSDYAKAEWNEENDWIPFYSLRSGADFFAWRDEVSRRGLSGGVSSKRISEALSDSYRNSLEAFHSYSLPAVIVEKNLEPEAVSRIFERVNRGGLRLSAFDLMVAKTFEPGWNLRNKWERLLSENEIFGGFFEDSGMPIIRVIALEASRSVRESDVLKLSGEVVRREWDRSVQAMDEALSFLRDRCGVWHIDFVPYPAMLSTLAGVAARVSLVSHAATLEAWFWSRAFAGTFEEGANTVAVDEYEHLLNVINGTQQLRVVDVRVDDIFRATRKRKAGAWRSFLAALRANTARDLISGKVMDDEDSRVVNMLPRGVRSEVPDGEQLHLRVFNLALADAENARLAGSDGLLKILRRRTDDVAALALESQFLTTVALAGGNLTILESRRDGIEKFIRDRAADAVRFV